MLDILKFKRWRGLRTKSGGSHGEFRYTASDPSGKPPLGCTAGGSTRLILVISPVIRQELELFILVILVILDQILLVHGDTRQTTSPIQQAGGLKIVKARQVLVSELAFALDISEDDALARLEDTLS